MVHPENCLATAARFTKVLHKCMQTTKTDQQGSTMNGISAANLSSPSHPVKLYNSAMLTLDFSFEQTFVQISIPSYK